MDISFETIPKLYDYDLESCRTLIAVTEETKDKRPEINLEDSPARRRHYSPEDKVRIVLAGIRGAITITELCRSEGINQNLYYRWHNEFLEAGKQRLAGNTSRTPSDREMRELRAETAQLKRLLGEILLENRLLKKKTRREGESEM